MSAKNSVNERISFASIQNQLEYPDFLEIQLKSFMEFFQLDTTPEDRGDEGLYKVFNENFPISDTRNNFVLEFIDYFIDPPRYSIEECIERGLTYSVPLKAKLKLYCTDPEHEDFDTVIQDVYLGTIPYMTERGLFVINGAERVVVSASTAHLVYSSDKAFMRMVQNSIQQELSRSGDLGSSLQPTSIM
jgi:DNA-directed RNA polymerase subunit beta